MLTAMAQYWRLKQLRHLAMGVGAAVGILLAVTGALAPTGGIFPDNVVARVNDKMITSSDLLVAQSRLAADGRVSSAPTARHEALRFRLNENSSFSVESTLDCWNPTAPCAKRLRLP